MATEQKSFVVPTEVLVTKSNQLVEACYRLDLVELRIIMMAIHIGRTNDLLTGGPDRVLCDPIRIDASLFTQHFPMHEESIYKQLKAGVKSLLRKPLSTVEPINGRPCPVDIPWFSKAAYIASEAAIEVEFNHHVLPYISRLSSEFTEYRLAKIGRLSSAHAVRVYEMLAQYLNLGKREIDLDRLRKTLMIEGEYKVVADLRKRVIDPAVKQINDSTDLQVSYVQKKRGHVITSFLFTIQMKDADKPKTKLPKIDEAMIAATARPGETHDDAYHRIRDERAAAKKPARKKPLQMNLTGVDPAVNPQSPEIKLERAKVLAAARELRAKNKGVQ